MRSRNHCIVKISCHKGKETREKFIFKMFIVKSKQKTNERSFMILITLQCRISFIVCFGVDDFKTKPSRNQTKIFCFILFVIVILYCFSHVPENQSYRVDMYSYLELLLELTRYQLFIHQFLKGGVWRYGSLSHFRNRNIFCLSFRG